MAIMFNRFVEARFLNLGLSIGGRMFFDGNKVVYPPTIKFNITHTSESEPNEAEIILTNLSPETQRLILVEGEPVEIESGYWPQDGNKITEISFRGQIRKGTTNSNNGIESKTRIQLGDGDDAYSNAKIRKVFEDKSHRSIVGEISKIMSEYGIKSGRIDIPDFYEERPRTVDRLCRRELDDICYQHDRLWSIQDNVLNIYPRDEALERTSYVLSPETGVINTPHFDDKGITIKTLMIPDLRPGFTFSLINKNIKSRATEEFKIESISMNGDNSGGEFCCNIKGKFFANNKVIRSRQRFIGQQT